ncbi:MAG: ATP-binding cassette domain-containing protein, partial [Halothiobacillaceae bacterium]
GGQQQRVSIARALAKNPRVMFCDEPTGALDAATGRMVLQLLTDLNERLSATIVIITHAAPIASLAQRIVHLTMEGASSRLNENRAKAEDISW